MKFVSINQISDTNNKTNEKLVLFLFNDETLIKKVELNVIDNFDILYKQFLSYLYIFGFNKIIIDTNYDLYLKLKDTFESSNDYKFFISIYNEISIEYLKLETTNNSLENFIDLEYGNINKTIGIDIGGSDIKVACLIDEKIIYSNEVIWHPKDNENLSYHINMINSVLNDALTYLNNDVDNIKISSAGVIKNNQVLLANLYKKVKDQDYKNIYIDIVKNIEKKLNKHINYFVFNDGDVSAIFGLNYYKTNNMLGLALGTSLAAGYINDNKLQNYLNEPSTIKFFAENDNLISDYLSQDGVINLSFKYNLIIDENLTKYEKLKYVQNLFDQNNEKAKLIFKDIGYILADFINYLSNLLDISNVILQGRVLSNNSGKYLYQCCKERVNNNISIYLPDENFVRIGQAIAVANIVKK